MTPWTRRSFLAAAGAGLAACTSDPSLQESPREAIDRNVATALNELYSTIPGAQELGVQSMGILIIPKIRQAGFFASGLYGEGALMIGPATVDYYSLSAAGFGLTFGVQEFSQALFFLSDDALRSFRVADGWQLGADAQVAVPNRGGAAVGINTTQINRPIQEVVFGQRGLLADASLSGAKYSRIIR